MGSGNEGGDGNPVIDMDNMLNYKVPHVWWEVGMEEKGLSYI